MGILVDCRQVRRSRLAPGPATPLALPLEHLLQYPQRNRVFTYSMHDGSHPLVDSGLLNATHRADCPGCRAYAQAVERLTESISRLQQQVSIDHLTRGANRYAMEEAIVRELQRTQRFGHPASLVICDLDGFKFINDAYGHSVGDRVLREVGDVLLRHCRSTDVVGRWGGDEFAVLMPNTADASAVAAAEKLRAAVRSASLPLGLRVTASLGVAGAGADDKWEAWVNRADHAMFEAKRQGRNRVARATTPSGDATESRPGFLHMTWRPAYCSGHPLLDRQHEALFEVANAVLTVAVTGDLKHANTLFGGLVQECRAHFAEEEEILASAGYPGLEAHAATHRTLLAAAEAMQARLSRGEASATELFELIARDLIAGHILKEDRDHLPFTKDDAHVA